MSIVQNPHPSKTLAKTTFPHVGEKYSSALSNSKYYSSFNVGFSKTFYLTKVLIKTLIAAFAEATIVNNCW